MKKRTLINWCRSCHFDALIAIKEVKGNRWMSVLSYIENKGDFSVDDYNSVQESWAKILDTLNKMEIEELDHLDLIRYN